MKTIIKTTSLEFRQGGSDKVYKVDLFEDNGRYGAEAWYGRRGSTMNHAPKVHGVVEVVARNKYNALIREKEAKGYISVGGNSTNYTPAPTNKVKTQYLPQLLNPITEDEIDKYIRDDNWIAQEKEDGKRIGISVDQSTGELIAANRKGLQVGIPDFVEKHLTLLNKDVELDGEMVGDVYKVFDILSLEGEDYRKSAFYSRLSKLEEFLKYSSDKSYVKLTKTAKTTEEKQLLYETLRKEGKEGIVFKHMASHYEPGRPASGGTALKCKFWESASCIVSEINDKRSVALMLVNKELTETYEVGNVTIPINWDIPETGDVVEIKYLYAFKGGSLIQPIYMGRRDDIDKEQCTLDQLKFKNESNEN